MAPPSPRRWRGFATSLTAAGMVAVLLVAGAQVARGWRAQEEAARLALRDQMVAAATMFADWILAEERGLGAALVAPARGASARAATAEASIAAYERYGQNIFVAPRYLPDSGRGYFIVDLATGGVQTAGSLARDTALARHAVAKARQSRIDMPTAKAVRAPVKRPSDGEIMVLWVAVERGPDGAAIRLHGAIYTCAVFVRSAAARLVTSLPLLPRSFSGRVDWRTAARLPTDSVPPVDGVLVQRMTQDARVNDLLAVGVSHGLHESVYHSPRAVRDAWGSPFAARYEIGEDGLFVHVALSQSHGERLVRAAVPRGSERWLLGALLALGVLLAGATVVEVHRQRQLARARADFVSAVSHELRTPLAHITLLAETLLDGGAESPEQHRRWLRVVRRESQRLHAMVDNVLLFARGEGRRLALHRRPTDVAELAREVAAVSAPLAAAREARLRVDAPPACHATVDGGAVRQVLVNLIDNAVKYGPAGQEVVVRIAAATLEGGAAGVRIAVEDEGAGIPLADRERVLQPFVRLTSDGATGGSGLGLSVVRQLVEAHGGVVAIDARPGGGASVAVVLPAEGRAAPAAPAARRSSGVRRRASVAHG